MSAFNSISIPVTDTRAQSAALRFAGYAALFDIADASKDIITPGAFKRTLEKRSAGLPIFWQHKPEQLVGTIEHVAEDMRGLRVIGLLDNPTSRAADLLKRGEVNGLSFGYRAKKYRATNAGRMLDEIELFEVSLVTHPLQYGARVHLVT